MRKWILRGIAAVVVLGLAAGLTGFSYLTRDMNYGPPADRSAWEDQAPSISSGYLAYIQRDVMGARAIWQVVAADDSARSEDRAEALRLLSRTSWRIYQNTEEALAFAAAAQELTPDDPANAIALSAAWVADGDPAQAMAAIRPFVGRPLNTEDRIATAEAMARAALSAVEGKRLDELTSDERRVLGEAWSALAPFIANPPAQLDTSALALAVAVRTGDGAAVGGAWASYYHSPDGVSAMADVHEAAETLAATLPRWTPGQLADDDRRAIAIALAQSFFFEEAALLLTDARAGADLADDPELAAIVVMGEFVHDLQQHTDEYYRAIAAANSNSNLLATLQTFQYRQGRKSLGQALWDGLGLSGDYDERTLGRTAADRFGLYFNEGPTSGVYDLHAGFRVLDTTYTANQYGRTADLRYVVVGRMISNGYETWLWDRRQQHGGWASADTIYQVRPAYADDALRRWSQLTDPAQRAEEEDAIERETAADADVLGATRLAFLPGLAGRLHWQAMNQILDHARATAGGESARASFALEMGDAVRFYSIFAHEGRHALDKLYAAQEIQDSSPELEFRAKISQVVFSDWPRLALGSIFNANMGDGTPHGIANERLMEGVLDWMEVHASEIDGLDADAPLLPQFDLLDDDQIRAAFRAQDPWAQEDEEGA